MTARIDRVEVSTASETGAAHQQRDHGCDDAVGWSGAAGDWVVATVAIADGHSDRRCVRSQTGAAFVVAAAAALPVDAQRPDAITQALVTDWRRRVDTHLDENPLSAAELDETNARIAYGTTAALCRITHDGVTIVRVGDGDVIAVAADGQARRIAVADNGPSDVTESISGLDAERVARTAEIAAADAPVLLLLATDGFDNAYPADESMLRAASELAALRRESGAPISAEVLGKWARDAADVSGDDATVAAIWIEVAR